MFVAIEGVDHGADDGPDDEPSPRSPSKRHHHRATNERAGNAGEPGPRSAERPGKVRPRMAQNQHSDAHRNERRQCADGHHLAQYATGNRPPMSAADMPVKTVPSWASGISGGPSRSTAEQSVASHREENARLGQCHDQHDRGHSRKGAQLDGHAQPVQGSVLIEGQRDRGGTSSSL